MSRALRQILLQRLPQLFFQVSTHPMPFLCSLSTNKTKTNQNHQNLSLSLSLSGSHAKTNQNHQNISLSLSQLGSHAKTNQNHQNIYLSLSLSLSIRVTCSRKYPHYHHQTEKMGANEDNEGFMGFTKSDIKFEQNLNNASVAGSKVKIK